MLSSVTEITQCSVKISDTIFIVSTDSIELTMQLDQNRKITLSLHKCCFIEAESCKSFLLIFVTLASDINLSTHFTKNY